MKKHTLLLACAMRILLNLIALPDGEGLVVGIATIRGKRISNIRGEPTPFRYARQPLPEEGARMWGVLSVSIPPSFGRRCPQGGGWRRSEVVN